MRAGGGVVSVMELGRVLRCRCVDSRSGGEGAGFRRAGVV